MVLYHTLLCKVCKIECGLLHQISVVFMMDVKLLENPLCLVFILYIYYKNLQELT